MVKLRVVVVVLLFSCASLAQQKRAPNPDLELKIHGLQYRTASSDDPTAALAAALDMAFRMPDLCCGKDSTLEDSIGQVMPMSLELAASKIQGRKILPDGSAVVVSVDYLPASTMNGAGDPATVKILGALHNNQPILMLWNKRIYVIYGAEIDDTTQYVDNSGATAVEQIDQLLLFDPASGRHTAFTRGMDDWSKVQGLLTVRVAKSSY